MKNPTAYLGTQRESCKKMADFRRFGVKEPHRSETVSDQKCYLYRRTRQNSGYLFLSILPLHAFRIIGICSPLLTPDDCNNSNT